ncbi:MAG: sulfotransferase [Caldilineaceae bacterium]|nr:sulfotransferase [Caldilineaceae bacterium]
MGANDLCSSLFCGPLFIVGRPRSGTKLLRTLLNEHLDVSIPPAETHFIVPAIKRYGLQPRLDGGHRFEKFYAELAGSTFYRNMKSMGKILSKAQLQSADLSSWASICEVILKFYGPKGLEHAALWGDKTPSYLTHMALLKRAFPAARFLHILRDPRDYCLSMLKVWGRNSLLSAELWRNDIQAARQVGEQLGEDYAEIRFEKLLSAPEETLRAVCAFVGIDYLPAMVNMSLPSENLGDATGQRRIVDSNQQKYLSQFAPDTVRRIEEIVYPLAIELGYTPCFATHFSPLYPTETIFLRFQDGMAWTKFHFDEKGIRQGLAYLYRSL